MPAAIESIEFIYTTLASQEIYSGDNTGTITISSVDTDQTIIIAQCRNPNNAARGVAAFELTNSTTITWHRSFLESDIEVYIYVVEFDSTVDVQRGYTSSTSSTQNVTITSVDTTEALVLQSTASGDDTGYTWHTIQEAYLSSATNLVLERASQANKTLFTAWQVIELPDADIQSGQTSLSASDSSEDVTITAVSDTSNTVIHHSVWDANDETAGPGLFPQLELTSTTNLNITRYDDTNAQEVAWQVVEVPNWDVQRIEMGWTEAGNTEDETISTVSTSTAFPLGAFSGLGGQGNIGYDTSASTVTNANFSTLFCLTEIDSTTNVEFYRAAAAAYDADYVTYIVNVTASGSTVTGALADGIDLGDTFAARITYAASLADGVTFSDAVSSTATLRAAYSEGLSIGEAFLRSAILRASYSDGITTSDDPGRALNMPVSITDGSVYSDLVSAIASLIGTISEGVDLGDSVSARADLQAALAEGLNLGDAATATALYNALIAEGVDFGDAFTGTVVPPGEVTGTLVDALVMSDAYTVEAVFRALAEEGIDIGDTFSAVVIGALSDVVAEGVTLSDTILASLQALASIGEGIDIGDAFTATSTLLSSSDEGLVFSDALAAALNRVAALSEGLTLGDVFTATVEAGVITGAISEGIVFSDSFVARMILRGTVSDGMDFSDTFTTPSLGRYLIATISLYAALSASSTTISPGLNTSSINIKPD